MFAIPPETFPLLRTLAAVAGCALLSYYDIFNRKNIPDLPLWLFLGISILAGFFLVPGEEVFLSFAFAALTGALGYISYRYGHIGGADVVAAVSISLLLPSNPQIFPQSQSSLPLPFIFPIAYYSILAFCIYILALHLPRAALALSNGKTRLQREKILESLAALLSLGAVLYLFQGSAKPGYLLSISIIFLSGAFFILFGNFLRESMARKISPGKLQAEDVIAIDLLDRKISDKHRLPRLVTQKDLARLKSLPLKKIPVYSEMPFFLPFLLIGLLAALVLGDSLLIPF